MVGFSISSWRNRFPPFDTLSCSVIIYCVNLEICDFYIFFFTGIGYTSKKGELILSKKTAKKTKNKKTTKWCDISTAQKKIWLSILLFTVYMEKWILKNYSCNLFFGQKVYEKKRNRMQVFCKKKNPSSFICVCMYVTSN